MTSMSMGMTAPRPDNRVEARRDRSGQPHCSELRIENAGTDAEHRTGVITGSVADLAGSFRFGIEEEYFLVDAETKAIAPTVPEALFTAVKSTTLGRGKCEFLQQQLEVATEPHVDMVKARAELRRLRHMLAAIAEPHGLAILAAGTHPTPVSGEILRGTLLRRTIRNHASGCAKCARGEGHEISVLTVTWTIKS